MDAECENLYNALERNVSLMEAEVPTLNRGRDHLKIEESLKNTRFVKTL